MFWHLFCSQPLLFQLNVSRFFSEQPLVSAHIYTSYTATVPMGVKPYAALRIGRYHQWVKNASFFWNVQYQEHGRIQQWWLQDAKLLRPHNLPPLQHCISWNNPCKIHHSSLLMNSRSSNWLKQNETNVLHLLSGTLVPELKGNVPFYLCQGRLTKFRMSGIASPTSQWTCTKAFGVPQVKTVKVIRIPKIL